MTDTLDAGDDAATKWRVDPTVHALETDGTLLVRAGGRVAKASADNLVPFVSRLLAEAQDGRVDLDQFGDLSAADARRLAGLFDRLAETGLLMVDDTTADGTGVDDRGIDTAAVDGLWARAGHQIERSDIANRLATTEVSVVGSGVLADRIADELRGGGIANVHSADRSSSGTSEFAVVVGQGEEDDLFTEWNEVALAGNGPTWLAVTPLDGQRFTIGPWVFPHSSACYHCYRLRRGAAFLDREVGELLVDAKPLRGRVTSGAASGDGSASAIDVAARYPTLASLQASLVADLVLRHVALKDAFGQACPGGVTTVQYELAGIEMKNHRVLRVPRCPKCSPAYGGGYPQVWFHREAEQSEADQDKTDESGAAR